MKVSEFRWTILVAAFCAVSAFASGDSLITAFPQKISVQFLTRYPFMSYSGESASDENLQTNRSIDLGLGGGYGDWTWSSLFAFSFGVDSDKPRTYATDYQLNYYGDRFFWDIYLKAIDGFYVDTDSGYAKLDLLIVEAGFDLNFFWNPEHSLRAAYALDRRQWESNGSFILGGGVYYTGIRSEDSALTYFETYQQFAYAGPNVGYSYTWVWESGWFLNLLGIANVNWGMNLTRKEFVGSFQIFPSLSAGFHGDSWSVHFPVTSRIVNLKSNSGEVDDFLYFGAAGFMVTKRF